MIKEKLKSEMDIVGRNKAKKAEIT